MPEVSGYKREPDNWYREEPWCSARLFAAERFQGRVVDPCAGFGTIVRSAIDAGLRAEGYDLRDRGYPNVQGGIDFFEPLGMHYTPGIFPCDNIVSNPPYATWKQLGQPRRTNAMARAEDEFLRLALKRARYKVALFLPSGWLNSDARGKWITTLPLYRVYLCSPRPSCPPGPYIAEGGSIGNGKTDYSWFVFLRGFDGAPTVHWLRRNE